MNIKDVESALMRMASNCYKITVESEDKEGRKLLSNIITKCLENDYSFRTLFASAKIIIDDASATNEDIEKQYTKIKEDVNNNE